MSALDAAALLATPEGYQISRSVRLRSSASGNFSRTLAAPTNNLKWTWSAWVKRGTLGVGQALFDASVYAVYYSGIYITASDQLQIFSGDGSAPDTDVRSANVLRDPSAWYHLMVVFDSANATAADRNIFYINGVRVTSFAYSTPSVLNEGTYLNSARLHGIGRRPNVNDSQFDGYITENYFIDGQALTPASFGETDAVTGVWKPKKYAGTYGTNGFYLNFADNSAATAAAIGKDSSGNGNNWTPNNISVTAGATYDSMIDTPTPYADGGNGRGNYAVLSYVDKTSDAVLSDGNLKNLSANTGNIKSARSTIAIPSSGLYYAEFTTINTSSSALGIGAGIASEASALSSYNGSGIIGFYASANTYVDREGTAVVTIASSLAGGSVLQVAVDATNGKVWFGKNNVWYDSAGGTTGDPSSGANPTVTKSVAGWFFRAADWGVGIQANFGQRPFSYTPPTGFKALNTQNLPEPTIKKGNQYFDATLWTGDSTNNRALTNSGAFAPDLVWIKDRAAANYHNLFDTSRGVGNRLVSNATTAEESNHAYGYLSAFGSGGFTVTGGASGYDNVNLSAHGYVGWQWKESATAGFDIVTYTANAGTQTIAHSLGVAPSMIITARRSSGGAYWGVYHKSLGASQVMYLQTTSAATADSTTWNATAPTSSVFSVGNSAQSNNPAAATYVAYLFSEVAGFSKFGSYTGNGSADGPFVYCGFRPKFVMIKSTTVATDWYIYDTARTPYNEELYAISANNSGAEYNNVYGIDALSNGFKVRQPTGYGGNNSGGTYIFAAFAEVPTKYALAR